MSIRSSTRCSLAASSPRCAAFFLDHYIGRGSWRRLRVRGALAVLYLDARLKTALLKRVDGVIGVSQSILEIYSRAGRIPTERAQVVYNLAPAATDVPVADRRRLAEFGLPDRPLVLYVGKRSLGKGFPVFVEAARAVAARGPEACFLAVGAGEAGAADGVGAHVRLLSSRTHADVEALYALADIVV